MQRLEEKYLFFELRILSNITLSNCWVYTYYLGIDLQQNLVGIHMLDRHYLSQHNYHHSYNIQVYKDFFSVLKQFFLIILSVISNLLVYCLDLSSIIQLREIHLPPWTGNASTTKSSQLNMKPFIMCRVLFGQNKKNKWSRRSFRHTSTSRNIIDSLN